MKVTLLKILPIRFHNVTDRGFIHFKYRIRSSYPFDEGERCEGRSKQQVHRSETVREEKEEEVEKDENKVNEENKVEEKEEEEETNGEIVPPTTSYGYNDEDCCLNLMANYGLHFEIFIRINKSTTN